MIRRLIYMGGVKFVYPYYVYRVNGWTNILHLLQQSLYAESMVCSMSSQLYHIPETKDLQGNNEMHTHLVPASYHRVTTVGSAQRLVNGEQQQSIVKTLIACIRNAEKQDQHVREGLKVMEEHANSDIKPFIQAIQWWQQQAEASLQQAKQLVEAMGLSLSTEEEATNSY